MADMQSLVERLEKAVGRLEAVSQASDMHRGYGDQYYSVESLIKMFCNDNCKKLGLVFDDVVGIVEIINSRDVKVQVMGATPYVQAFDSLLAGPVAEYLKISKEIGGDVQKHAEMVHTGLKLERALLVTASQCQQPAGNKLSELLAPISEQIQEVITFREKNRGSKLFNHLSAVSESIQALGWVAMAPKPGPYVKELNDAAMFYTNRVLKEYKDVDKKHVDWVKAYLSIWTELQTYIKEFHTTGLAWSKTGPVAKELSGLPSGPSAVSGPPPPPPGPPPPPVSTSSGSDDSASRSALFAQINQGESITHALKHVSDDMKTHKNPALKAQSGPVRSGPKPFSAPKPGISPSPKPAVKKEPPLLELEGKKWRTKCVQGRVGVKVVICIVIAKIPQRQKVTKQYFSKLKLCHQRN
ncbi:PREDICTED: adenylyl cyclase-associated protein 1 [Elephantulus edwardii]|uniref:adenylyl cyclase-associated protein 1 n=1 Tax=Elephantulus edwardii TaxID=28737 RepID=UPI0003F09400|nr:PREDICTED: adenylyl cyclase-associated protein 1 [Elephantulus edwardii]